MNNGQEGQPQPQTTQGWNSRSWLTGVPPVMLETPVQPVETPATHKPDRSWMKTPEGRAKIGAAVKAGWAKKRLKAARTAARHAAQEREQENRAKSSSLDAAIAHHQECLKTLLAAKALLK